MAEKLAYRKLVRDPNDNQLRVAFIDAATGQVLTDTTGYRIVDQGVDFKAGEKPKETTPTPTPKPTPKSSNRTHSDNNESKADWIENRPGASRGISTKDIKIGNPLDLIKAGMDTVEDVKNTVKKSVRDWVVQTTGNTDLFPGELNKAEVTSSVNGVPDTGFTTNVPPQGAAPIPATRSTKLDEAMGAPDGTTINNGSVQPAKLVTGEVARNVVFDPKDIKIRDLAVNSTVTTDLAAIVNATDPTVTVKINSGGQVALHDPSAVKGVNRTKANTTNHDVDVNGSSFASDQQYYKNGKQITPASDPAFFKELAKNATIAGFTQIGMGGSIVHLGKDPKDDHLRTWGYDAAGNQTSTPALVSVGVKEGQQIASSNPDAYVQMVSAVARPDSQAPVPASKGSQNILGGSPTKSAIGSGGPGNVDGAIPAPAVIAANSVREALGLDPILDATQKALADVSSSIPRYDIDMGGMPPMDPGMLDTMSHLGDNTIGGAFLRTMADKQLKEGFSQAIGAAKQIVPAVASNMLGGAVDTLNNTISGFRNGGFMSNNTPVNPMSVDPKLDVPADREDNDRSTTINPTPQLMASAKFNDVDTAKAQVADAKSQLEQSKAQAAIEKALIGKGATGKPVSEPIPVAYTMNDKNRRDAIIRTIWGEARGEGEVGQLAVANVIKNRSLAGGADPLDLVKMPEQFDGYKVGKTASIPNDVYEKIGKIVDLTFDGSLPDNTGGAMNFHANWDNPGWASSYVADGVTPMVLGGHTFYPKGKVNEFNRQELTTGFIKSPTSGKPISEMGGSSFMGSGIAKTNEIKAYGLDSGPSIPAYNSGMEKFMDGPSYAKPINSSGAKANDRDGFVSRTPEVPASWSSDKKNTFDNNLNSYFKKDDNNLGSGVYATGGGTVKNSTGAKANDRDSGKGSDTYAPSSSISSGSKSTGAAATGFMAGPTTVKPQVSTPSAVTKAVVSSGSKATSTAAKTTSISSGSKATSTAAKTSANGTSQNTVSSKFND